MDRKYSIFHPIIMAFYSPSLYRDVAYRWTGIAASYLLLLLFITWLPTIIIFNYYLNVFSKTELPQYLQQIPAVKIYNGELSIDKPVPYSIKSPRSGKTIAVIDTSGKITSLEQANANVLVTKTQIFSREDNQTKIYDLAKVKDFSFDRNDVGNLFHKSGLWLFFFIFPLAVIVSFIYRILQALIYGAIGILFSKMLHVNLIFQQCMRLAIIAMTPAIIISLLLDLLGIHFRFQFVLYFLISMIYLYFAIASSKVEPGPVVVDHEPPPNPRVE
jgi:Protein of unknown function (DUF1189)